MPVPVNITELDPVAASNYPTGGESVGTNMDNYLRTAFAFLRQLYDSSIVYCGNGVGADTIVLTPSPAMTAHKTGQLIAWIQASANTTNVTVNPSSLGARAATKRGAIALAAGELPAGALVLAFYDGTQYQVLNTVALPQFLDSVFRIQDNVDPTKQAAFELAGLTAGTTRTITVPDANITLVGTQLSQAIENKTITNSSINGVTPSTGAGATNFLAGDGAYKAVADKIRAFVNFNGGGTVTILSSFNVASITDRGVGTFTVNFTSALSSADYAVAGAATAQTGIATFVSIDPTVSKTTTACGINTIGHNGTLFDTISNSFFGVL